MGFFFEKNILLPIFAVLITVLSFSIHDVIAATTTVLNQASCTTTLKGMWDNNSCTIFDYTVMLHDTLQIPLGVTLVLTDIINNYGIIDNSGTISSSGSINNIGGNIINSGTIYNHGTIYNNGKTINSGTILELCGSTFSGNPVAGTALSSASCPAFNSRAPVPEFPFASTIVLMLVFVALVSVTRLGFFKR